MKRSEVEKYISEQLQHDTLMANVIFAILAVPVVGAGYLGFKLGSFGHDRSFWVYPDMLPLVVFLGFLAIQAGAIWHSNLENEADDLPEFLQGIAPALVAVMIIFSIIGLILAPIVVPANDTLSAIGENDIKLVAANLLFIFLLLGLVVALPLVGVPLLIVILLGILSA